MSTVSSDSLQLEVDYLVTDVFVLTMNDKMEVIENGYCAVKGKKIIDVGSMKNIPSFNSKNRLKCPDFILMPGLINSHCHSPMTIFRGFGDDLPMQDWLKNHIWPAEIIFTKDPETVKIGCQLGCLELLQSGSTTVVDGYFQGVELAKTYQECGIRGIFGEGLLDMFPTPSGTDYKYFWEKVVPECEKHELSTSSIFPHSIYGCSKELLKRCKEDMEKHKDMLISIHCCETAKEVEDCKKKHNGMTPVEYLNSLGLLTNRTILAHCCHLTENDIKLLMENKVGISHNISSNMKLTSGSFPFEKFWGAGYRKVSIGTDGAASNNGLDMIREMNIISKFHKLRTMDPTCCKAEEVVYMATRGGSKCIEKDDVLGSIEKGKFADFILIDTMKPHLQPMYNPYSHIVYAMKGSDITHVFVNGVCRIFDGKHTSMNEKELLKKIGEIGEKIRNNVK